MSTSNQISTEIPAAVIESVAKALQECKAALAPLFACPYRQCT